MLVRVLIAFAAPRERRRWSRLVTAAGADASLMTAKESLLDRLNRQDTDLLVVERGRLGSPIETAITSLRERPDRPEILVVTERESSSDRATLLAAGCLAVLPRSLEDASLREALATLLDRVREESTRRLNTNRPEERYRLSDFISESQAMKSFMRLPVKVAGSDSTVLILGETGVGKERLARSLHGESRRSMGPFLAVNCGALPESLLESELFGHEEGAFTGARRAHRGYFEMAHGGTLFLDEIGEMPLHIQVRLLRVLEERGIRRVGGERSIPVDVRIMAASNRDLEGETRAKRFRPDLYFRLAVVTLELPPLRERREDIPGLLEDYLVRARWKTNRAVTSIRDDAVAALCNYAWPGNVRELINVVEQACLLGSGPEITLGDLPTRIAGAKGLAGRSISGAPELSEVLELPLREARRAQSRAFETAYLSRLLSSCAGRIGMAARQAGISERALYDLMLKNNLRKEDYR